MGLADGGRTDGGLTDAGRADAGAVDAGRDASGADAAVSDGGLTGAVIACAPVVPAGPSSGIVFSSNVWSGFRFQITGATDAHVSRVGLQLAADGAGTAFATIVRLSGASDMPDDPMLAGADVVVRALIPVAASSGTATVASGPIDATLSPGWYALAFGTGAYGATVPSGNIPSGGGTGCVSAPGSSYPFSLRQSDGMFILQGAEPHFFVQID